MNFRHKGYAGRVSIGIVDIISLPNVCHCFPAVRGRNRGIKGKTLAVLSGKGKDCPANSSISRFPHLSVNVSDEFLLKRA